MNDVSLFDDNITFIEKFLILVESKVKSQINSI